MLARSCRQASGQLCRLHIRSSQWSQGHRSESRQMVRSRRLLHAFCAGGIGQGAALSKPAPCRNHLYVPATTSSPYHPASVVQAAQAEPPYRLLIYEYVSDILEKRAPYRAAHLAAAEELAAAGKCVLGGAAGSPPRQGVFVMHGMSEAVRRCLASCACTWSMNGGTHSGSCHGA